MDKTRILFVVFQLAAGGSEKVVFDLVQRLDPSTFEVYVVAFNRGVLESDYRRVCKEVYVIEKQGRIDISTMFALRSIINKHRIDVVNAHHYMPFFYSFFGAKTSSASMIYTEHSVPEVEAVASTIHRNLFQYMLFKVDAVIGVSRQVADKFKEYYPLHRHKIWAIPNGVDVERFCSRQEADKVRKMWGISSEHFVVGTIANFRKIKNHICLLRAAARLKNSHPDLRLIFVGTGFDGDPDNSEEEVRRSIADLGLEKNVILTGYYGNIPEILSSLDVFCLPSFSEGLPLSVLEAMAAGIPVIGSQVRGIEEVVAHRKTGILFDSDDDEQLSRAIVELKSSPLLHKALSRAAFDYVSTHHHSEQFVQAYSQFFRMR